MEIDQRKIGKKKILVVEDNIDILENIETALRLGGFDSHGLMDGGRVMEWVLREKPDLIVMDIMIPKPNGYQLSYMIKSHEQTKNIPILILSAKRDDIDVKLGYRMGADRYMTKPFRNEELVSTVRGMLGNPRVPA